MFTHAHPSPLLVILIECNDTIVPYYTDFVRKGGVILVLPVLNEHVFARLGVKYLHDVRRCMRDTVNIMIHVYDWNYAFTQLRHIQCLIDQYH